MVSALVLIPLIGTQRTFISFALLLAVVAAAGLGWRFVAVPVALAAAFALPVGTVKATDSGTVIYEGESEQQYIRVIESEGGERDLELNEGQAVHSTYRPGLLPDGRLLGQLPRAPVRRRSTGRRSGSRSSATPPARSRASYGHYWPETDVDGVEIDPELTEIGNRYFDMGSNENLTTHTDDARPWLRRSDGGYEMIVVDAYRQPYIPFYLATEEFFELVRDRLAPGGVVVVNVGHPEGNDEFERVIGRRWRRLPDRPPRSGRADEHADDRQRGRRRAPSGSPLPRGRHSTAISPSLPASTPPGSRRRCPGARSTQTTTPRSSG